MADHEIGRVVAAMQEKDAGAFYQNSIIVVREQLCVRQLCVRQLCCA